MYWTWVAEAGFGDMESHLVGGMEVQEVGLASTHSIKTVINIQNRILWWNIILIKALC